MFKSDFRIVADYFAHRRKDKKYIAGKQTIRHVNEVLQMLRIVADDQRFDPVNDFICIKKGEPATMDKFLDEIENSGIEKGKVKILLDLVTDNVLTLKDAASRMNMTIKQFKALAKSMALL